MQYTIAVWNGQSTNPWIRTAHSIASFTLVPFLLIGASEALVKNGLFLAINSMVFLANQVSQLVYFVKNLSPEVAAQ